MERNDVAPHQFRRLRRFFNRGRCLHCFMHEDGHPTREWVEARPLGDASPGRRRTLGQLSISSDG